MRALTVLPGSADSAELSELPEPSPEEGAVLVAARAVGVCGTDKEIVGGEYGTAPEGSERLVIGHESLGEVVEAPEGSGLRAGDLVVGIVRRPDPVPCRSCAAGEPDMCRNGRYTEHGIEGVHGFARDRWRVGADELVKVDPALGELGVLLEPTSVVFKAWEQVDLMAGRTAAPPERVLVTGAGPVGLLAALLGAQRGLDVHVLDQVTDGPKPDLVRRLGATYHSGDVAELDLSPDVVVECTGVAPVIAAVLGGTARNGIVCLTGVSSPQQVELDLGALNRSWVLENDVVFGTVNANRRHYEGAAAALADADRDWLESLISRRVPVDRWSEALQPQDDDVKTVLTF